MTMRRIRAERGLTIIELLVALAVFTMFALMIDAVFFGANRTSRKIELAADVQQNARIAVERLTREIRESSATAVLMDTSLGAGRHRVLFKSARLLGTPTVFCLYVRSSTEPLYNPTCFNSFPGSIDDIAAPPYTSPEPIPPRGTYTPIWQQYIGYYVVDTPDGLRELRRVSGQLNSTGETLNAAWWTGGSVVASMVESFDLTLAGSAFTVTLKAQGREIVQGSTVPVQEVKLPGRSVLRN